MYAFACPSCAKQVPSPRPAKGAQVKCPQCGATFQGSTLELPDPPQDPLAVLQGGAAASAPRRVAGGSASPSAAFVYEAAAPARVAASPKAAAPARAAAPAGTAPPAYRAMPKRDSTPAMIIAIAGIVLIFAAVFGIRWYVNHTYYVETNEAGATVFEGWLTNEEAAARKAALEKKKDVVIERMTAAAPSFFGDKNPQANSDDDLLAVNGPAMGTPAVRSVQKLAKGDPRIALLLWEAVGDPMANNTGGYIVGEIRNEHDVPAREIRLTVQLLAADGELIVSYITTIRYVPSKGNARFSIPWRGVAKDNIAKIEIAAETEKLTSHKDVWEISLDGMTTEVRDEWVYVVKGPVKSPRSYEVFEASVYGEFYDREGVLLGSGTGQLESGYKGRIGPGKTAFFVLDFDTRTSAREVIPQNVASYRLCLVADKE